MTPFLSAPKFFFTYNFAPTRNPVVRDEEKSFWLLVCLLEDILPPNYFTSKMSGLTSDCLVLKDLIAEKFQFDSHDDDQWNLFAVKWFVCIYIDILPIQVRLTESLRNFTRKI